MNEILKSALAYREHGFSVVPMIPGTKKAYVKWKELQSRIASTEEINRWWKKWPDANVAIICGKTSGIDCLDGDGPYAFDNLESQAGITLPETVNQTTGRPEGGEHRIFKYHGGGLKSNSGHAKNGNGSAVDFRTDGGLFVAAPSVHETGKKYQWAIDPLIEDPAEFPSDLLAYLKKEQNIIPGVKGAKYPFEAIEGGVPAGNRNDACASYAGHCFRSGRTYEEAVTAALMWNKQNIPPMDDAEVVKTVQSIAKAEGAKRAAQERKMQDAGLTTGFILDCLEDNEIGDGRLFCKLTEDYILRDHGQGSHAIWVKHHWDEDITNLTTLVFGRVTDAYKTVHAESSREVKRADGKQKKRLDARIKKLYARIQKTQTARGINSGLTLAAAGRGLKGDEWDQKPWLLPCENGVVNLKTGKLEDGRPGDYLKTACPVSYDTNAKAPIWDKFLSEIFNGNQDLKAYVKRLMGYSITGMTNEDVFPILHGKGGNGKTLFLEIIKSVVGDLSHKTKASTLIDSGRMSASGSADADLAAFRGRRIVYASETNDGNRLNVGKIKEMTGSDTLNARVPFAKRAIEFKPTHTLFLITNSLPYVSAADYATWRRVALIPFNVSFVDKPKKVYERKVDNKLMEKLMGELPGVFYWLLEGCLEWQKEGLNPPDIVKVATSKYRASNDLVREFFTEHCVIEREGETTAGKVYQTYRAWCYHYGHEELNGTRFGKEMIRLIEDYPEIERATTSKPVIYKGLTLIDFVVEVNKYDLEE